MSAKEIMVGGKPLTSLRVVDLKEELEKRGLSKSGSKKDLAERLRMNILLETQRNAQSTADEEQLPNLSTREQLAEQNPFIRDYFASQAELYHSQKVVKKLYEGMAQTPEGEQQRPSEPTDSKSAALDEKDEEKVQEEDDDEEQAPSVKPEESIPQESKKDSQGKSPEPEPRPAEKEVTPRLEKVEKENESPAVDLSGGLESSDESLKVSQVVENLEAKAEKPSEVDRVKPSEVDGKKFSEVDRMESSDVERVEPSEVELVEPSQVDRVEPEDDKKENKKGVKELPAQEKIQESTEVSKPSIKAETPSIETSEGKDTTSESKLPEESKKRDEEAEVSSPAAAEPSEAVEATETVAEALEAVAEASEVAAASSNEDIEENKKSDDKDAEKISAVEISPVDANQEKDNKGSDDVKMTESEDVAKMEQQQQEAVDEDEEDEENKKDSDDRTWKRRPNHKSQPESKEIISIATEETKEGSVSRSSSPGGSSTENISVVKSSSNRLVVHADQMMDVDEALDYGEEEADLKKEYGEFTWSRRILRLKNRVSIAEKSEKKWTRVDRKPVVVTSQILELFFPDVKPLPESEVRLEERIPKEAAEEIERAPPKELHHLDEAKSNEQSVLNVKRKISIIPFEETTKELTPPRNPPSDILIITNLTRPFTLMQLKELLQRTGTIQDIWVDKIKSRCLAKFEKQSEAEETRAALHGIQWPPSNPKALCVDFSTLTEFEEVSKDSGDSKVKIEKPAEANNLPVREWDLGKRSRSRSPGRGKRGRSGSPDRKRSRKSASPRARRSPHHDKKSRDHDPKEETQIKALDELFRKTATTPCLYWLPLTPEQISEKEEMRRKRMIERERRLAEMEKLRPR